MKKKPELNTIITTWDNDQVMSTTLRDAEYKGRVYVLSALTHDRNLNLASSPVYLKLLDDRAFVQYVTRHPDMRATLDDVNATFNTIHNQRWQERYNEAQQNFAVADARATRLQDDLETTAAELRRMETKFKQLLAVATPDVLRAYVEETL